MWLILWGGTLSAVFVPYDEFDEKKLFPSNWSLFLRYHFLLKIVVFGDFLRK